MGEKNKSLNLNAIVSSLRSLREPYPAFTNKEIIEFLNMSIEEAMGIKKTINRVGMEH